MTKVAAVLLAAGESRRMGQLKALLPWQGVTLLESQIAALRDGGVERVMVVLGHQAERLKPLLAHQAKACWVYNPRYQEGKTTSIKAGLKALELDKPDLLVFLNVDQPRSAALILRLLEAHQSSDCLITIPTHQGKGGHPIILNASLWPELEAINEETLGIKSVTQNHQKESQRIEVNNPEALWDLNTPEQYQTANLI